MFCDRCQAFWDGVRTKANVPQDLRSDDDIQWTPFELTLHQNLGELQRAADSGCSLCAAIWSQPERKHAGWFPSDSNEPFDITLQFVMNNGPKPLISALFNSRVHKDDHNPTYIKKRTVATFEALATALLHASHVENNGTGSKRALDVCDTWVQRCLHTHEGCRPVPNGSVTRFKPTRLIDVSGGKIRLVSSSTRALAHEYVALSHCWGLVPIIRTLKANLNDHLASIRPDKLSRTFRDAIHTTRALGFHYIWIDSLCIVQDESNDWAAEAATMCDVYSNAKLTIAAAHAAGGDVGCFYERDGRVHAPFLLPLGQAASSTPAWAWFMTFGHIPVSPGDAQFPLLYGRAWVLQEQLLSPRMLVFNRHHLQWECMTLHDSDASPGGGGSHHSDAELSIRRAVRTESDYFKQPFKDLADRNVGDTDMACYKHAEWHQIVQAYTHRGMTNTNDRLVALAGIANALGRGTSNRYQAGLWSQQLWRGLLWEVTTMEGVGQAVPGAFDLDKNKQIRHASALAPTWSWASITAPVAFHHDTPMIDCICDIVKCSVTGDIAKQLGSLEIHGHVRHGYVNPVYAYAIREAAAKRPAMSNHNPNASGMRNLRGQPYFFHECFMFATKAPRHHLSYTADHNWGWRMVRGEFHADDIIETTTQVTFLAIAAWNQGNRPGTFRKIRTDSDPITVYSLALIPTGSAPNEYRRVGLAIWNRCAWFGYRCGYEPPGGNLRERRTSRVGGPMDVKWKQKLRKLYRWPDLEFYQCNKSFEHVHKIEANALPDSMKYHYDTGVETRTITIV